MSDSPHVIKLVFVNEFKDREAKEARDRGYLSHVLIEVDGNLYPVFFYDSTRLQQDLEMSAKNGRPFIADPGMIILPDLTIDAMQQAAQRLYEEGFFGHLLSVSREHLSKMKQFPWPPEGS